MTQRRTPQGDAELMAKEQVLGFKPAPRLEQIDDESAERVQDCQHRPQSCDDSASRHESQAGWNFRKGQGKVFSIASSSSFSPRLRSASSLIVVMSFLDFRCDSVCGIFHRSSNISAAVATLRKGERLSSRRCLVATQFLHRLLHLLERTHLDLTDALARDAKLGSEILECERVVGEPARLEDTPLALVEHVERRGERLAAVVVFVTRGERSLLAVTFINQPVLPFAGIAVLADRRVEGRCAA